MNFLSPTYNQIESKAVARMLGVSKAAKLDWTWYAVLGLPPAAKAIDTTVSKDGITGAFFSSKDRKAAVEEAEKRNRDALGLGDGPHPNLLKHLQANGDASTSFDSSLMSKFEVDRHFKAPPRSRAHAVVICPELRVSPLAAPEPAVEVGSGCFLDSTDGPRRFRPTDRAHPCPLPAALGRRAA